MNRDEFVDIMGAMVEMYPGRFERLGDLAMEMWFECLSDLDYKKTREAVKNHVKLNKFPPTVADIREHYGLLVGKSKSDAIALRDVFNEMRNYYPGGNRDNNAENVFLSRILELDANARLSYAIALKNTVIDYVSRCEQGTDDMRMTLSECIEWAVNK